jgi:DNA mismatch repair protein MutL
VAIEGGGVRRILVADDGHGILVEDVPLLFARHATSKLRAAADLQRIATGGFRGEALASIASVSRLTLTTHAGGEPLGTRVVVDAGKLEPSAPHAGATGTTVEVEDLFHSVPARRKFLRAAAAETAASTAMLERLALAHPGVALKLEVNGRTQLELGAAATLRERAAGLLGRAEAEAMIAALGAAPGMRLELLAAPPEAHRKTRAGQHLLVNRRPVADKGLSHALSRAYDGLVPASSFPPVIVVLTLEPTLVDVNVHPQKNEVRFADARAVQALVSRTLRQALVAARVLPALEVRASSSWPAAGKVGEGEVEEGEANGVRRYTLHVPASSSSPDPSAIGRVEALPAPVGARIDTGERVAPVAPEPVPAPAAQAPATPLATRVTRLIGQLDRCFLVAEDGNGLVLLDQHTAHERIVYERLLATRAQGATAAAQRLLVPEVVHLGAADAAALATAGDELLALGVELEPMDGGAFAVRALPPGLQGGAPALLRALAADLGGDPREAGGPGGGSALEARRHRLLATVACRSSVQKNTTLAADKMGWILEQVFRCDDPYLCPHGRAVMLRFDADAIRKGFGRTW